MPIKIPNELPAVRTLEAENIFVMTETRAITQDIRPLKILILNLMPTKIVTETQLLRKLANTPLQIEVELLRTDDPTGKKSIQIKDRAQAANDWGADLYLDFHHNAGINLGKGGGVVAISKKNDTAGKAYRDAIYASVVAAGNLRGNRSNPTYEKNFKTMQYAKMPAVIVEFGFMDSKTDYPVISTEAYAKAVAYAVMEAVARLAGLSRKTTRYRVQVGYFSKKENALALQKKLQQSGFDAIIREEVA